MVSREKTGLSTTPPVDKPVAESSAADRGEEDANVREALEPDPEKIDGGAHVPVTQRNQLHLALGAEARPRMRGRVAGVSHELRHSLPDARQGGEQGLGRPGRAPRGVAQEGVGGRGRRARAAQPGSRRRSRAPGGPARRRPRRTPGAPRAPRARACGCRGASAGRRAAPRRRTAAGAAPPRRPRAGATGRRRRGARSRASPARRAAQPPRTASRPWRSRTRRSRARGPRGCPGRSPGRSRGRPR